MATRKKCKSTAFALLQTLTPKSVITRRFVLSIPLWEYNFNILNLVMIIIKVKDCGKGPVWGDENHPVLVNQTDLKTG